MFRPVEYKLVVEPDSIEEKTAGGILLPDTTRDAEKRAQITGTVIAIGPKCCLQIEAGSISVGDQVYFAKYGGYIIEEGGKSYRVINDEDVVCKVEE